MRPVKDVLELIVLYMTYILNLCLSKGVFPKRMQIAKVTILYKRGDKNEVVNHRACVHSPVLSKGLEKVLYSCLSIFTEKHNVITDSLFGFYKNKSIEMTLLTQKSSYCIASWIKI